MKNVIFATLAFVATAAYAGDQPQNPAPMPKHPDQQQGEQGPMWTCHRLLGVEKYINCEEFVFACDSMEKSGTFLYSTREDITEAQNCEQAGFLRSTYYCHGNLPANGRELGEVVGKNPKGDQGTCSKDDDRDQDQGKEHPKK